MSIFRLFLRLVIILVCALIGAGIGTVFEAYRIEGTAQAFHSEAKLSVNLQVINQELEEKTQSGGTMAELLETAEMSQRALERVKALNPDLAESHVTIRATQTKGSGILVIRANGQEPRYTRTFLDALVDEFLAFRHSTREEAQGPELQKVLNEVAALQKEMKETETALEKARAGSVSANVDQVRLQARLTTQRNQRDERRLIISTMAENDEGRALLQTRLSAIELEIKDMEAQVQRHEAAATELRVLTEKLDALKQAYEQKSEKAAELQTSIDTDPDSLTVMERATPAFEIVEDWRLPIGIAGGAGALIGLVMSRLLVSSLRPTQRPRAV
ncbi:MAG: hypothetical protein K9N47_03380 [Prosthecobacter sp.]|uniref:hypothetical protein n=1 Tax=Prosthecobacter sp. TaxID=1965333 RepID=UPI0025F45234|nr:hypothetical protein [Prosthecobacter sp.]MCF7785135.1 hypothetical protein [Prosthecobacter sp.]